MKAFAYEKPGHFATYIKVHQEGLASELREMQSSLLTARVTYYIVQYTA